jgi:SNF2 family DNA or RNA helicase
VIHGTWIPRATNDYLQEGAFCLWVEKDVSNRDQKHSDEHPAALRKDQLETCLKAELGIKGTHLSSILHGITPKYFTIPTFEVENPKDRMPVKSYELLKYSGEEPLRHFSLHPWKIWCYEAPIHEVVKLLKDLHFLLAYHASEILLGTDLLFWFHYTQAFKEIILKDQYIPALQYRELPPPKDKRRKKHDTFQIYPTWETASSGYRSFIPKYAALMPQVCAAGVEQPQKNGALFSKAELLRHFSENLLAGIIAATKFTNKWNKSISNTWVDGCVYSWYGENEDYWKSRELLETYKKWVLWKEKLFVSQHVSKFDFCFQLQAAKNPEDDWKVHFLIQSKTDPSLKIMLDDYWHSDEAARQQARKDFGRELEKEMLLNLGYAAKMYPKIWEGLETDKPGCILLNLDEAFQFLKEVSWILEDAGYKVIIPAWWTPKGRRKAKIKVRTAAAKGPGSAPVGQGLFGYHSIIQFRHTLAIGGEEITPEEWLGLVNAKTPLVQFRGQWIELDRDKMQEMLKFWQTRADEQPEMSILDLLKMAANEEEYEFDHDAVLAEMLSKLRDKRKYELIDDPSTFNGKLRDYQKRGVSWIRYLENLGLGGCLADDMGLGKTIQVIAQLLNEREAKKDVSPTLLIAPTSVLGNWQKEIERFAPNLQTMLHHGSQRIKDEKAFTEESAQYDVVISSYALARRDEKLFKSCQWERIVLDEAQNIKNPQAAQTRSILKFKAPHRLALTGTPVENRLMDLWSIFNFLNTGYLGTSASFRKVFEMPIQKDNDMLKPKILKNLVEPFILRRVKTDREIIKDLPDKVEQKVYCNLTKEQASLYEALVQDVIKQIEESEGIQRKGVILSSLVKLKQICNHPAQFLQDASPFSKDRSHKLSRLTEMIEEVIESGESLLIFSQFKEICEELDNYLRKSMHYSTYLLHGGISRQKRQKMIEEFQDPDTEPSIFILSLKAGGVGITLTKANHVFHFDRWWNPAVENQATDRAFRIGQQKNVFVHKYLAVGTLEERIDQMIEQKKRLSESIVGSEESWLTELDNEAIKNLITLNKSAILE